MTQDQAKSRIAELTEKVNYYNDLYYQNDISKISDYDFDQLLNELMELENKFPSLKLPDSPSQRVGGTITKSFETVYHQYPMLSLGNTYSEEDLRDFDKRVAKGLGESTYEYICELKIDGVALSISYENGIFSKAVTRGDGEKGDNVSNNAKTIKSIPLKIRGENIPENFAIHLKDSLLEETFDLRKDTYSFQAEKGLIKNRFSIVFLNEKMSLEEENPEELDSIEVELFYSNQKNLISILNPDLIPVNKAYIYTLSGQFVRMYDYIPLEPKTDLIVPLKTNGVYILHLETAHGKKSLKFVLKK